MTEVKGLLPIGSIVLLERGRKPLMIFGVVQTNPDNGRTYDYIGVPYPEGNMGNKFQFLFNKGDIKQVIFRGYEDEMRERFLSSLEDVLKSP